MGLFDISIHKKTKLTLDEIKNQLSSSSQETTIENGHLLCSNYKVPSSLLKYNLDISLKANEVTIEGELQNVLVLVFFIIFGILFTYGILVILIAGYAFLQKKTAEKELTQQLDLLE